MEKKFVKKIDVEPKWIDLVPLFVSWIESGTPSQKEHAISEIKRIAEVADVVRQEQKKKQIRG